jgi:hypothetical protein
MRLGRQLFGISLGLTCMSAAAAQAADQASQATSDIPRKALPFKAPPKAETPFFLINDNRITFSQFQGSLPGFSARSLQSTVAFTHFDAWAYGTNTFSLLRTQFDRTVPTAPCFGGVTTSNIPCAAAATSAMSVRSTLGWNELFDTKIFALGPLTNISFIAGGDANLADNAAYANGVTVVSGLQFNFALPYKGYFQVSPQFVQRTLFQAPNYPANVEGVFATVATGNPQPMYSGLPDGVQKFVPTWGLDLNYYMDLGFLPENVRYFAISGRASIRGGDGNGGYGPYNRNPLYNRAVGYSTEPIRLTFDGGSYFWGQKYAHLVDLWAAWRYDYNISGFNEALDPNCIIKATGASNGSCGDNGVYYGMTIKLGADVPGAPQLSPFGVPFLKTAENSITYGYLPNATTPGVTPSVEKYVYAFTHNDTWAYGTNYVYGEFIKSGTNDPTAPCSSVFNNPPFGVTGGCSGEVEFNAKIRSTLGFNELFNTTKFRTGMLRDVSFEVGADMREANGYQQPIKEAVVAGLQFAIDLPYKGYLNVAPLYYQERNHSIYAYPNNAGNVNGFLYGVPTIYRGAMPAGFTGTSDGNLHFNPTWALEVNYGGEIGFLPESLRYFSYSGHVNIYGPKGNGAYGGQTLPATFNTKTEFETEPLRLSLDLSKALWGQKYSHYVEPFIAYRYWANKYGAGANAANGMCSFANGTSNGSCTEKTVYVGVTSKF